MVLRLLKQSLRKVMGCQILRSSFFAWAVVACAIIFSCISCNGSARPVLAPGDAAPSFTLEAPSGEKVSLGSFAGKVVLLNFWAPWCGPCVSEMPSLEALSRELGPEGLVVLAVAVDTSMGQVQRFREAHGITFPMVFDNGRVASSQYRVSGFPESYVIDRRGRIAFFPEPDGSGVSLKIVGPREWNSTPVKAALRELLSVQ